MSSKEKILEFLESNKDSYTSGEAMATALGLSRNAVWKAINDLRKAGYAIDAISNKGYRLATGNDILSTAGIISYLNAGTAALYNSAPELIHIYKEITSTNNVAMELSASNCKHGTLVLADEQTSGRARSAGSFDSPKGGLYMSVVLTPAHLPSQKQKDISAFIGQSVCDAIAELSTAAPELRPVNDIYIEDQKICGILTEASTEFDTGRLQWLVAGIGIRKDIHKYTDVSRNQIVADILNRLLI